MSGIAMFMLCGGAPVCDVWCSWFVMSVWKVSAGKDSVYFTKRINSSLLTKIFND